METALPKSLLHPLSQTELIGVLNVERVVVKIPLSIQQRADTLVHKADRQKQRGAILSLSTISTSCPGSRENRQMP
jgi:hypothetical protein